MAARERLHRLVDNLPESELVTAAHVLEALRRMGELPAVLRDAPPDDERLSNEAIAALDEAEEDIRADRLRKLDRQLVWKPSSISTSTRRTGPTG
ncbi:hypothetical protein BH18GEM1_BH18GEM1_16040 [soil metagenome]